MIQLDVPLVDGFVPVPEQIAQDPLVHRGHVLDLIFAVELVDLAEDQVVDPAHLRRDDLRRLPGGRHRRAAGVDFVTHDGPSFELLG
jgi:hypothetical protein